MPSNLPIDGHSFRRVEVLTGVPRRRHWGPAEKAAIVTESFAPGAVTSSIALRHGLHRNQLYAWRRERRSAAVADAGVAVPDFVPVVAESRVACGTAAIEIEIGGTVVRAGPGVDLSFLGEIAARRRSRLRSVARWCVPVPASTCRSSARLSLLKATA